MNIQEVNNLIIELSRNTNIFVSDKIKKMGHGFEKFVSIIDARSLSFFSIGVKNTTTTNVCFIIDSNEITDILTGVTEANYQQQKIIIVCIGKSIPKEAFDNYISDIVISKDTKYIMNVINEYVNGLFFKPLIINIDIDIEIPKEENQVIDLILNKIEKNAKICTNINSRNIKKNENVILWENQYGVIYRYLGNIIANPNDKIYLLTTYTSFCEDINAFYTRYINDKIIIIYLQSQEEIEKNNMSEWAKEIDIDFVTITRENIKDLDLKSIKKQTIIRVLI